MCGFAFVPSFSRSGSEGDNIDVGFGSGDSLLMQLEHPDLPRPKSLRGITSMTSQYHRAWSRVQDSFNFSQFSVSLYQCDAVFRGPLTGGRLHPLDPASKEQIGYFDSILALDCAYHFSTRELFLKQCLKRLRPGSGRIALADLCFEPSPNSLAAHSARLWASALSVPAENLITLPQYHGQLHNIGFQDIQIEDISDHVFPGFVSFLSSRGFIWAVFASTIGLWRRAGGKYVLVTATRPIAD